MLSYSFLLILTAMTRAQARKTAIISGWFRPALAVQKTFLPESDSGGGRGAGVYAPQFSPFIAQHNYASHQSFCTVLTWESLWTAAAEGWISHSAACAGKPGAGLLLCVLSSFIYDLPGQWKKLLLHWQHRISMEPKIRVFATTLQYSCLQKLSSKATK